MVGVDSERGTHSLSRLAWSWVGGAGAVLHVSNEPGELSQWLCHDDSTINIVFDIIIIMSLAINSFWSNCYALKHDKRAGWKLNVRRSMLSVNCKLQVWPLRLLVLKLSYMLVVICYSLSPKWVKCFQCATLIIKSPKTIKEVRVCNIKYLEAWHSSSLVPT